MLVVCIVEGAVLLVEECGRDGLDAGWCLVGVGVFMEFLTQTKVDTDQVVQLGVSSPHTGKDLCHAAQISLNSALLDSITAHRQAWMGFTRSPLP